MIIKLLCMAGVLLVLMLARRSRPLPSRQGSTIEHQRESTITQSEAQFKVATFNVQTGKSLEGKRNINRAANVIADADLVGIQEVYAPSLLNLIGLGQHQTKALATPNRFGWLFCATRMRWLREHRGNALLSKLKIDEWQIEPLPDQSGKSYRNMTIAKAYWQDQPFYIINTHLHTRQGREQQLEIVLREFAQYPRAILLGDFNSRATTPQIVQTLKDIEVTDAITAANLDLDNADRIDWILTKGFKIHDGHMLEKGVSDHPYYQVTLSISDNFT